VHSWDISPEHATGFSIFVALSLLLTQFSGARRRAEAEHLAHMRFLESMDRVNRAIQGTGDLEQMMNDVLDAVLSIFQCDRAVLGRHSGKPDTTSFTLLAKRERPGFALDLDPGVELAADDDLSAMSAELKAAGGPVQWVLGSLPPAHARVLAAFGVQSVLSMPIEPKIEQRDWMFVFTLRQCTHPRVWTPEEMRLFQEIGRRFGDAVTTLSVLRDLRQSEARLEEAQRLAHLGYWDRDLVANRVVLSEESWRIFGIGPDERPADWTLRSARKRAEAARRLRRLARVGRGSRAPPQPSRYPLRRGLPHLRR
jgi:GAF domain-containing protein